MRQILFEISKQEFSETYYGSAFGVQQKQLYNANTTFTDFYGVTAYYEWDFTAATNILSVKVDKLDYIMAESLNDCHDIEESFYYDYSTQTIHIHFTNDARAFDREILLGATLGYSKQYSDVTENAYNSAFYESRLESVTNIKKEIDPSFYGRSKYQPLTATLKNHDWHFDTFGNQNLFGTSTRFLYAEDPTQYSDFEQIGSGFISDYNTDWEKHSIQLDDARKNLEQPVAKNLITLAEFPNAPDGSIDKKKPIVYGKVFYRKAICIDDSATAKFLFADTMYNPVASLDGVYIDGVVQSESAVSLLDGTFELVTTDIDNVFCSFTMPIVNGAEIIIDLMENVDNKKYLATYYDLLETNLVIRDCRNTSLYIDDNTKLKDAIEKVCFDCDIRYFYTDTGKITMRLYNENREYKWKIYYDDFIDQPGKKNNGSEYLTQCTVKYQKRDDKDEYQRQYENTDYFQTAYDTYKKEKPKTFETGLYEDSAAIAKSETIMKYSSNITDIFIRTVNWNFKDIELCDFVLCAPFTRVANAENETLAVHEVIGVTKDLDKWQVKLTLRYVKPAPIEIFGADMSDGFFDSTLMSDGSQSLTENMQITERL